MSEQAKVIPSTGVNPITESDLAVQINAKHDEVVRAIRSGAQCAIEAGELLSKAKAEVGHGNFLEWIGANCRFTQRTAQSYMKLAREKDVLMGSNAKSISHLSFTEAIELLEQAKSPNQEHAFSTGKGGIGTTTKAKKDRVAEAIKDGPLAILQRAWEVASENERKIFMQRIGAGMRAST